MKKWLLRVKTGILHSAGASFQWLLANAQGVLAFLALLGIGVGCWWILPALGLIVPSVIVLTMLTYSHLQGTDSPEDAS